MNTLRNSKGFTLIELIIIIIILGIISAVAIPKYIDMKTDAEKGTARGILGALASSESLLFSKYILNPTTTNSYDTTAVLAGAGLSGGATAAIAAKGSITLPNGAVYNFTYTAGTAGVSAGQYTPSF